MQNYTNPRKEENLGVLEFGDDFSLDIWWWFMKEKVVKLDFIKIKTCPANDKNDTIKKNERTNHRLGEKNCKIYLK